MGTVEDGRSRTDRVALTEDATHSPGSVSATLCQEIHGVIDRCSIEAMRPGGLPGQRDTELLRNLHERDVCLTEEGMRFDVEQVQAVVEADHRADHDTVFAKAMGRPLACPIRSVLEEVHAVAEPIVLVPADPKSIAEHDERRLAGDSVIADHAQRLSHSSSVHSPSRQEAATAQGGQPRP
jgi:hypothetical protein